MNYEEKYKQLHKFISDLYPYMSEYCKEKVEGLIPELAEFEDEKVRKELIEYCRNTRCVTEKGAERIAKWIAWIEKQCKNLTDKEMKELLHTEYEKGRADTIAEMQKPAWSNNEKLMLADIIEATERSNIFTEDYQRELVDWLKTLKQRNTWKPSKEQMLALKDAEGVVGSLTIIGEQLKSLYQDLKKL